MINIKGAGRKAQGPRGEALGARYKAQGVRGEAGCSLLVVIPFFKFQERGMRRPVQRTGLHL